MLLSLLRVLKLRGLEGNTEVNTLKKNKEIEDKNKKGMITQITKQGQFKSGNHGMIKNFKVY